jgi:RimJ/RimL family protein N-acetyltransferase
MNIPILYGQRITLRPFESAYVEAYCSMFSSAVAQILHTDAESERQHLTTLSTYAQAPLFYCIFDNLKGCLIGASIIRYDGSLYTWLNEAYWGQGLCKEVVAAIAQLYFKLTSAPFLSAYVDVLNKRSYAALIKAGFAPFGIRKGPAGKQHHLILRKQ